MTVPLPILVLPYVTSVMVKLSSLFFDRRLILSALDSLAGIPPPLNHAGFALDKNQQEVIARYVGHASLVSMSLLTVLSSFIAAIVLVINGLEYQWVGWLLPIILIAMILIVWWVLPSRVYNFRKKWLGIKHETWLILLFCCFDILLAITTILCTQSAGYARS
jgi:hypothetical protein